MYDVIVIVIVVLLLANLVVAFWSTARHPLTDRWLLAVLLSGTSGAAVVALTTVLLSDHGSARLLDVAVVLIALTALPAAVRVTAHRGSTDRGGAPATTGDDSP